MFSSVLLEKNHRQGKDKEYADLLNRVRMGEQTEEDLELLSTRVRKENHKDLKTVQIHIGCKRKDVAERNEKYIFKLPGKFEIIIAKHHNPTVKNFKPSISSKDGVVGSTSFMNQLTLKIGAKVMIIHNIDVPDMLCNGQIGTLIDVIKPDPKKMAVDMLIIKLVDSRAGEQNKRKNPTLSMKYPDCVFIERVNFQYTLRKKSVDIGSTAHVIQFPVRLAYAITAHKVQGQTFAFPVTVSMDISSVFEAGQAYVMLSRVQCIEQLFIVGELNQEKIKASQAALNELRRLENISFNRNPTAWHQRNSKAIRIASVNCCGLLAHIRDIRKDWKLLCGDVIYLLETSLPTDIDTEGITINRYNGTFLNIGKGKGMVSFIREDVVGEHRNDVVKQTLQIQKFSIAGIDSISVYRSSSHSLKDVCEAFDKVVDVGKPTLITGDFNVCTKKNERNVVTASLTKMGFQKMIERPTHIEGGHIDHIYWLDKEERYNLPKVEFYSPYWTDHDGLLVTITER